jgi:hypothetical protein
MKRSTNQYLMFSLVLLEHVIYYNELLPGTRTDLLLMNLIGRQKYTSEA